MTPQATTDGIGATLKAEREGRSIPLETVARSTHVRIEFLQLIETDRFEGLPSGAYAKGFVRSYAAFLGLDPQPFLEAFDRQEGAAGTDLRRLAPKRVRVPPDVQRRAWQVAVGFAAGLLVLLTIFGVFGGGESPQEVPDLAAIASDGLGSPAPNPMGAVVRVDVIGDESWVEVIADDQLVFAETLLHGGSKTFKGADEVVVFVARGDQVQISANGQAVGRPEGGPYRGTFTPSTTTLPPNEPVVEEPAATAPPPEEQEAQPLV